MKKHKYDKFKRLKKLQANLYANSSGLSAKEKHSKHISLRMLAMRLKCIMHFAEYSVYYVPTFYLRKANAN